MDMGPDDTKRLPMPDACCLYSYRTGWMDMGPLYRNTDIFLCPVPVAITATERVGWTWGHSYSNAAHARVPVCHSTVNQKLDGHGLISYGYRTRLLAAVPACAYSNQTGWMDAGPISTETSPMPPYLAHYSSEPGWMDMGPSPIQNVSLHAPCLLPLPNRLDGHAGPVYDTESPQPVPCHSTIGYRIIHMSPGLLSSDWDTRPLSIQNASLPLLWLATRPAWMDMGPLYDTERLPCPMPDMPKLPTGLDGHGTILDTNVPHALPDDHYSNRTGWMDMGSL
ncbi:hypothetical protein AVEN_263146-1 [Araneus ventricosus]|uniref:Uncharacterized protein n=1 Tax=Araneus ventricosus TaxID=182803 RepID=A0A4Y2F890_ARAVE|nr:hypothetical protein AVEN_263146-1 [Araneus ventricosus]